MCSMKSPYLILRLSISTLLTLVLLSGISSSCAQIPKQSNATENSNGLIYGSYTDSNNITGGFIDGGTNYISATNPLSGEFMGKSGDSKGSLPGSYFDSNHPGYGSLFNGSNSTATDERNGNPITWTQEH